MLHRYLLALGTALVATFGQPAAAFSDRLDFGPGVEMGGTTLPLMMPLDATPADTTPAPRATAREVTPPTDKPHTPSRARGDDFQRYFDRHYRAHLTLDAATQREAELE